MLNLSGLYGGQREPKNWLGRVFKSKEDVKGKGTVHFVHGQDVARVVLGVHQKWQNLNGRRWIVTDLRVYDWWDLAMSWGGEALERLKDESASEIREEQRNTLQEKGASIAW